MPPSLELSRGETPSMSKLPGRISPCLKSEQYASPGTCGTAISPLLPQKTGSYHSDHQSQLLHQDTQEGPLWPGHAVDQPQGSCLTWQVDQRALNHLKCLCQILGQSQEHNPVWVRTLRDEKKPGWQKQAWFRITRRRVEQQRRPQ